MTPSNAPSMCTCLVDQATGAVTCHGGPQAQRQFTALGVVSLEDHLSPTCLVMVACHPQEFHRALMDYTCRLGHQRIFHFTYNKKSLTCYRRWQRGTSVEVAYAMLANHGGGVSWRLCPADGSVPVTEECFQRNTLRYTGNSQWIRYRQFWQWDKPLDVPDFEIPLVRVTEGTTPPNSEWARNPIPSCLMCDQRECMSSNLTWIEQQYCAQACSGFNVTNCPPGMVQFPEPGPGLSGFYRLARCSATSPNGLSGFPYSVVSRVDVPTDLSPGPYLLSWRWDCEQSRQIWQNCADIILT